MNKLIAAAFVLLIAGSSARADPSYVNIGPSAATVQSVATGACLTGGTITTTGTVSGLNPVDARSTTTEAVIATDQCQTVTFTNANPVAATVAAAGSTGFPAGWKTSLLNLGAGTVTLTPTTSTVNGVTTLVLLKGQGCDLTSDGTNYAAQCGSATGNASVTGGTIAGTAFTGGSVDSSTVGATTASSGKFTSLAASSTLTTAVTGISDQCLHVDTTGAVSGTGTDCGSASATGTVNAVKDGATTVSGPTQLIFSSGAVVSNVGGNASVAITGATTVVAPQGRLTLTSGTPVMTTDVTATQTIYYDCYVGNNVPYYTGSGDALDQVASCEVSDTMPTSGAGVTNSAGVFDEWYVEAAHTICHATDGSGNGWAGDTGGSNTARGTGYSEVHNTRGYWTNGTTITHCYNGATDEGSITADEATYLGTFYTTAAGKTGMAFTPAAASGGTANVLGLWNAYSRVLIAGSSRDSASSWTTSSNAWSTLDASVSNRISWVDGLAQSPVVVVAGIIGGGNGLTTGGFGALLDATTGTPGAAAGINDAAVGAGSFSEPFQPQVGFHFIQEMQISGTNTQVFTMYGSGAAAGIQGQYMTISLPQ